MKTWNVDDLILTGTWNLYHVVNFISLSLDLYLGHELIFTGVENDGLKIKVLPAFSWRACHIN